MRTLHVVHAICGAALAVLVVALFAPITGSVWGNSFFGVPYDFARVAAPVLGGVCAGIASWRVHVGLAGKQTSTLAISTVISCFAYLMYAALHTVAYIGFRISYSGEPLWSVAEGMAFGVASVALGGAVIVPIALGISALCELIVPKIAP